MSEKLGRLHEVKDGNLSVAENRALKIINLA
jgi:hypothetical protein